MRSTECPEMFPPMRSTAERTYAGVQIEGRQGKPWGFCLHENVRAVSGVLLRQSMVQNTQQSVDAITHCINIYLLSFGITEAVNGADNLAL